MSVAHIDELESIPIAGGLVWHPIRRRFDIRAFGINAYTALDVGSPIVETHTESSSVTRRSTSSSAGRARFTVDGNEHELDAGRLVFVRDPSLKRDAIAVDADTVVLAFGGKPGVPHEPSAWETMFAAVPPPTARDWDEAIRIHEEALAERPDHPALLYNLACMEARGGRHSMRCCTCSGRSSSSRSGPTMRVRRRGLRAIRCEPGFPAARPPD